MKLVSIFLFLFLSFNSLYSSQKNQKLPLDEEPTPWCILTVGENKEKFVWYPKIVTAKICFRGYFTVSCKPNEIFYIEVTNIRPGDLPCDPIWVANYIADTIAWAEEIECGRVKNAKKEISLV